MVKKRKEKSEKKSEISFKNEEKRFYNA